MSDQPYQSRPGRTYLPREDENIADLIETVRRCNIDIKAAAKQVRAHNVTIYTAQNERNEALARLKKWLEDELANSPED